MSSFEESFAEQALERLDAMADAEFLEHLKARCPELLEDPGSPPRDAQLPDLA